MTVSNRERNYYVDNLKFILIVLVVIGHFTTCFKWIPGIIDFRRFIYIFHMPCFIFVSGYLAKRINADGRLRVEKIFSLLWLYLLFKVALALLGLCCGKGFQLRIFRDEAAPWYLLSLAVWYLLVPMLERVKPLWMLGLSFAVGLGAGYVGIINSQFSLSRTLVFLPFFAMGFYLNELQLKRLLACRLRLAAGIVLAAAFVLFFAYCQELRPYIKIVFGGAPYQEIASGWNPLFGGLVRLIWYLTAMLLGLCLMYLVPRGKTWFSVCGPRTLPIYILHVLLRNMFSYSGMLQLLQGLPIVCGWLILLVGSLVLSLLLGNRWFAAIMDVLSGTAIFKKLLKTEK